jgi:hypothetical protein
VEAARPAGDLGRLAKGRRFGLHPERVAFALALQRLCAPGSDLQGAAWAQTVEAQGFDGLALQHFYRTLPWLATIRHELEQEFFFQDRDLFSGELDLVFVDTTSVYLYRDGVSDLSATATAATVAPTCRSWCCASRSTAKAGRWRGTFCPATPPIPRRSA